MWHFYMCCVCTDSHTYKQKASSMHWTKAHLHTRTSHHISECVYCVYIHIHVHSVHSVAGIWKCSVSPKFTDLLNAQWKTHTEQIHTMKRRTWNDHTRTPCIVIINKTFCPLVYTNTYRLCVYVCWSKERKRNEMEQMGMGQKNCKDSTALGSVHWAGSQKSSQTTRCTRRRMHAQIFLFSKLWDHFFLFFNQLWILSRHNVCVCAQKKKRAK